MRFFLGAAEAAVSPGFVLFTSQWYTTPEQGTRVSWWFSFNGWGQIIGGVVAYGIAVGTESHPLSIKGWQLIFLIFGLLTALMGALFLYWMPDSQLNARFLTEHERLMAVERIRINQQGVGNKHFKWYQCKEALTDPMIWAFSLYSLIASIPNGKHILRRIFWPSNGRFDRRYNELLLTADCHVWFHAYRVAATGRASWRSSSHHVACIRTPWAQIQQPYSGSLPCRAFVSNAYKMPS